MRTCTRCRSRRGGRLRAASSRARWLLWARASAPARGARVQEEVALVRCNASTAFSLPSPCPLPSGEREKRLAPSPNLPPEGRGKRGLPPHPALSPDGGRGEFGGPAHRAGHYLVHYRAAVHV